MAREEVIGNGRKPIVLNTSGPIKVKVNDKYYVLKYEEEDNEGYVDTNKSKSKPAANNIIIAKSILNYLDGSADYPGDGKVIIAFDNGIYFTENGTYVQMLEGANSESSHATEDQSELDKYTFDRTVLFRGTPPFILNNNLLINNLNAQYLNGYTAEELMNGSSSSNKNDEEFEIPEDLTVNTIIANKAQIETFVGNINLKSELTITKLVEDDNSRFSKYGTDALQTFYESFQMDGLDLNQLLEFSKIAFRITNSSYNWENLIGEENFLYLLADNLICEPIALSSVNPIYEFYYSTFNKMFYLGDLSSYNGAVYSINTSFGTLPVGTKFSFTANRDSYNGSYNICDADTLETQSIAINAIVVVSTPSKIVIVTDYNQTPQFIYGEKETITDTYSSASFSLTVEKYTKYENECLSDIDVEEISIGEGGSVIGDLSGINDPTFGDLSGSGVYSDSSTLINPNIAYINGDVFIKITKNGELTIGEKTGKLIVDDSGFLKLE